MLGVHQAREDPFGLFVGIRGYGIPFIFEPRIFSKRLLPGVEACQEGETADQNSSGAAEVNEMEHRIPYQDSIRVRALMSTGEGTGVQPKWASGQPLLSRKIPKAVKHVSFALVSYRS